MKSAMRVVIVQEVLLFFSSQVIINLLGRVYLNK